MLIKQAYDEGVLAALVDAGLLEKQARNMSHPKGSQALASTLADGPVGNHELRGIRQQVANDISLTNQEVPATPAERLARNKQFNRSTTLANLYGGNAVPVNTHLATPISYNTPLGSGVANKSLDEILHEGRVAAKPSFLKSLLSKVRL